MVKPTPDHSSFKAKLMNGFLAISLLANILYPLLPFKVFAANSGAIWTTRDDCGDETQNVNHYNHGEAVYINGENFDANTELDWKIVGQPGNASEDPGDTVASGTLNTDSNGDFCIFAYTVANDDGGEYKASVGNKSDNYGVDRPTISPTPTPTTTPVTTPSTTPTPVVTPSVTPSPTEEATPTPTPTEEPSPTATPTEVSSPTPTPTPTDIPTPTPTIIIEENYVELLLTSICNENGQHKFRVRNQNNFNIDYSYELVDTGETAIGIATPGDSFFYVTSSQPGTTKIYYELNLQSKFTTKAQNTIECTPTVTPTQEPSPTPTPVVTLVSSPTPSPTEVVTPTPTPVITATTTPVISPTPHPAPKVCPLVAGPDDILINIEGQAMWANIALSDAQYTVNGEVPSGTYKVTMTSYDNHSTKPGQYQPNEEFFVILRDQNGNEVTRTNAISDLPEHKDIMSETVNNSLVVSSDIKKLQPYHNDYPSQANIANTIHAVCILFEPIEQEPTPTPTTTPSPAVCPLVPQGDEILVNLKKNPIRADMGVGAANYMLSTDIPSGTYNVILSSYDSHSLKPGQNQMHEKFYVILKDQNATEITRTNSISDLPEDQDLMFETVNNALEINSDVKYVQPFHKAFASNIAESIEPLCMLLDPVGGNDNPTPTPTGSDNQNPTTTPTLPIGDGEPTPTPTGSDNQNPTDEPTPTRRPGSPNQGGIGDGGRSSDGDNNGSVQGDSTTSPTPDEDIIPEVLPEGTVKGLARTGMSLSTPMALGILNLLILGGSTLLIRSKTKYT